jgi:hypothetical protein
VKTSGRFDMPLRDMDSLRKIETIIERDKKVSTYKFALLRGVIEISQRYHHLKKEDAGKVFFPLGLLIERWLFYYYPLFESAEFIPQLSGESLQSCRQLAFRRDFNLITDYYKDKGGFSAFYDDYQSGTIPNQTARHLLGLIRNLKRTITDMPMRHIGRSISEQEYSIITFHSTRNYPRKIIIINPEYLRNSFGTFSFSKELYEAFLSLDKDSLLNRWAKFTVDLDRTGKMTLEYVLRKLREVPG